MLLRDYRDGYSPPGEVGIEVEVEGQNLPYIDQGFWRQERDGSLRGEAMEYILQAPIGREEVGEVLQDFEEAFDGAIIPSSERTSVHIHLNFGECTLQEITVMCMLYYMVEEELFNTLAPHRKGNFYCLRLSEAQTPLQLLKGIHREGHLAGRGLDEYRYAALNLTSLWSFGSLEFRALQGTVSAEVIQSWIDKLLALKDMAKEVGTINNLRNLYEGDNLIFPENIRDTFTEGWEERYNQAAAICLTVLTITEELEDED